MPSKATLVFAGIFISSTALIFASAACFYVTGQVFNFLALWFPPGEKIWYGPPSKRREAIIRQKAEYFVVTLRYRWTANSFIWVSSGFCVAAGTFGLAGLWMRKHHSSLWKTLPLITAFMAFLVSFIAIIYVHVERFILQRSKCNAGDGWGVGSASTLTCSHELVACRLVATGYISIYNQDPNARLCRESITSRLLLFPFVLFSAMLSVLHWSGMRAIRRLRRPSAVISRRVNYVEEEPDMFSHVKKVENEEDWEVVQVYRPPEHTEAPASISKPMASQEQTFADKGTFKNVSRAASVTMSGSRFSAEKLGKV